MNPDPDSFTDYFYPKFEVVILLSDPLLSMLVCEWGICIHMCVYLYRYHIRNSLLKLSEAI